MCLYNSNERTDDLKSLHAQIKSKDGEQFYSTCFRSHTATIKTEAEAQVKDLTLRKLAYAIYRDF